MKSFKNTILENLGKLVNDCMSHDTVIDVHSEGAQQIFDDIRLKHSCDNLDLTLALDECRELIKNKAYNKDEKIDLSEKKIEECFGNSVSLRNMVVVETKAIDMYRERREFHRDVAQCYMSGLSDDPRAAAMNEEKLNHLLSTIPMNEYDKVVQDKTKVVFREKIELTEAIQEQIFTLTDFEFCVRKCAEKLFQ